jgi:hypothetical protein
MINYVGFIHNSCGQVIFDIHGSSVFDGVSISGWIQKVWPINHSYSPLFAVKRETSETVKSSTEQLYFVKMTNIGSLVSQMTTVRLSY